MQLAFDPAKNVRHLFATPVARLTVSNAGDINPRISEAVLARERSSAGLKISNKGGWHSENDLLTWPELRFADLENIFRTAITHMVAFTSGSRKFDIRLAMEAWANVNRAGAFNSNHIHPNNHWSGVYYVQMADFEQDPEPRAGRIRFTDPRGPITMFRSPGQNDNVSFATRAGELLLFPSWLYHSVNPFSVEATRISIAFNGRIDGFRPISA